MVKKFSKKKFVYSFCYYWIVKKVFCLDGIVHKKSDNP